MAEDRVRLQQALKHLAVSDNDMAKALAEIGPPPPREAPASFMSLLHIIVAQQVSKEAAAAISLRLSAAMGGRRSPAAFLALDDQDLKEVGFSRQKMIYGRDLALAMNDGRISIAKLRGMSDDEAIAALSAIKGIGEWSAEVFLLFSLKRPDIMPAKDLALIVAAQRLKKLPERPKPKELRDLAEIWRPYRSYAARFLWHYYRNSEPL